MITQVISHLHTPVGEKVYPGTSQKETKPYFGEGVAQAFLCFGEGYIIVYGPSNVFEIAAKHAKDHPNILQDPVKKSRQPKEQSLGQNVLAGVRPLIPWKVDCSQLMLWTNIWEAHVQKWQDPHPPPVKVRALLMGTHRNELFGHASQR